MLPSRYKLTLLALFLFFSSGSAPGKIIKKSIIFDRYLKLRVSPTHNLGSKINWLIIHHNEFHAARVMRWALKKYGGQAIEVINRKRPRQRALRARVKRKNFLYDPNRIFSARGVRKTLHHYNLFLSRRYRRYLKPASKYLRKVRRFFLKNFPLSKNKCLIALHNNMNRGKISIKLFKRKKDYRVFRSYKMHPKNFVIVTRKKHFDFLKKKGINAAWHFRLSKRSNDGSLSVHSLKNNLCYINIESRFGDSKSQKRIISNIIEMF